MRAKKQFGQHFLKSAGALSKIIEASAIAGTDIVLEIGPGTGILTEKLLLSAGKVVAIEKDRDLIPLLKEKFSREIATGKLELIEKDVLDFEPSTLSSYKNDYKLIANIPYYITGAILKLFFSTPYQPQQMVLLVQKEVAERIVTRDKKESILSLSVKAYGNPRIVAKVLKGSFSPPPTVDSAILSIEGINKDFFAHCSEKLYFEVIKQAFGQKRKTVSKTLSEKYGKIALEALVKAGIEPKTRPEDISLDSWGKICVALEQGMI